MIKVECYGKRSLCSWDRFELIADFDETVRDFICDVAGRSQAVGRKHVIHKL